MAALPQPQSKIPAAIFAAYVARNKDFDGLGFSPSMLGTDCDRALWLMLRWAPAKEKFDGRQLRLFQSGHIGETRMIEDLRAAGLEVYDVDPDTGKQFSIRAIAGHVRGKLDGIARGIPESPTKWHVVEVKTHNAKSFAKLKTHGVAKSKPEHVIQMMLYMHLRGIDRALYCAASKDNDDIHIERIKYDPDFCSRLMARLERILRSETPPAKITDKKGSFVCTWCKAKPLCWENSFARLTCRSCLHATPEMSGDAAWSCARWAKPLTAAEQREACPAHLYIPDLVPGVMGEVDEAAETIAYTLHDGRTWIDGRDAAEAPAQNNEVENDVDA